MNDNLIKIKEIQKLNIRSIRGMLKILKPIQADEASAVRLMLAQILQNESDAKKILNQLLNKTNQSGVNWESITEDIE